MNSEWGRDIDVNSAGEAFVTGYTYGSDIDCSQNAYDSTYNGAQGYTDIVVFRLNAAGSDLIYSTYIGGSQSESGECIIVNDQDEAIICGEVNSPDFPVTPGAFDEWKNGTSADAFVLKLNANGSNILYSTYLEGYDGDYPHAMAVGPNGEVYVAGRTYSPFFPYLNYYDNTHNGNADVFVSKLKPDLSVLEYSTFIGGSAADIATGLALNSKGELFISGNTFSNDFPITNCSLDSSFNGGAGAYFGGDAFLCKLDSSGMNLHYSSYIGGSLDESRAKVMLLEDSCKQTIYLGLSTQSSNFPTTAGVFQTLMPSSENHPAIVRLEEEISPAFTFNGSLCEGQIISFIDTTDECGLWGSIYDWKWDFGDGNYSSLQNPQHIYNTAGTYNVELQLNNCTQKMISNTIAINDIDVDLGNDTLLCENESIILQTNLNGYDHLWSTGDTTTYINALAAGVYSVEVSDGSCAASDTISIDFLRDNNYLADTILCDGEFLFIDVSTPYSSYFWSDNTSLATNTINEAGIYWVQINNHCFNHNYNFEVEFENCICNIFVPNAFTPNNDGVNDCFSPVLDCNWQKYDFKVFSRWGNCVFNSSNPNKPWDGKNKNNLLPSAVYMWYLKYRAYENGKYHDKVKYGNVTLLR